MYLNPKMEKNLAAVLTRLSLRGLIIRTENLLHEDTFQRETLEKMTFSSANENTKELSRKLVFYN